MDRFIAAFAADDNLTYDHLKSNMDRFIGVIAMTVIKCLEI